MFVRDIYVRRKNKIYHYRYLAISYRTPDGKVRHKHLADLTHVPDYIVNLIKKALKGELPFSTEMLEIIQGKSVGAIKVIYEVAKLLCIEKALGKSLQAKLALVQVAGRILTQGSRRYLAEEWQKLEALDKVFKVEEFDSKDLYENLTWLNDHQSEIEKRLFECLHKEGKIEDIFLYDVTSSYLEGDKNELAAYGFNRDGKKGKKQIVVGLLTDKEGYPVSVEVFKGNTNDTKTVKNQLEKLKKNFGVKRVVFVGDKGMLKSGQIEMLTSEEYGWHYLTSITKSQINTLLKQGVFQLDLFSKDLVEVEHEGVRYIVRRNPVRAALIRSNREAKINSVRAFVERLNVYLLEHKRAKVEVAVRRVIEKIKKLKLEKMLRVEVEGRELRIVIDALGKFEVEKLDGCYAIKTDVPKEHLDAKTAHDRYKDLTKVENAFKTMKTDWEELRPIYVRTAEHTRGHVFVVMLGYMIIKYITDKLADLHFSKKYIFESLDKINYLELKILDNHKVDVLPSELLPDQKLILKKLGIKL